MSFWVEFFRFLDVGMTKPEMYGGFHLLCCALTVAAAVILCLLYKKGVICRPHRVLLWASLIMLVLEIYKQVNYSANYQTGELFFDYQWYAFPFQFCDMPLYTGLLAGILRKGRVYDFLCSFLGTFAIFAGVYVMLYPVSVFSETIGINIHTMYCHGSMIAVGVFMLYTRHAKPELKTALKGTAVFSVAVGLACIFNEIAHFSGLLEREDFNMFYISPYFPEGHLPVYSIVQQNVPFPWCLLIYIAGFALASLLVLLISLAVRKIFGRRTSVVETQQPEKELTNV